MVGGAESGELSQSPLAPRSDAAESISDLWWFMLVVSAIVVGVVVLLTLVAVLRRDGALEGLVRRLGGRGMVAFGGIFVPVAVLSVLFALTLNSLLEVAPGSVRPQLTIEVRGHQWFWTVRYPGREQAVTANEIHVPVGVPVEVRVRTEDVIHSFWMPQLNRKVDMIPGRTNRLVFTAREAAVMRGQCAELCGVQHANMAFVVVAQEPAEFQRWLDGIAAPASPPETASARRGQQVFSDEGCARCHTIRGTPAAGDVGPDLTHVASRRTLAAATIDNSRGDLGGWILDPQHIKPGNLMPATGLSGPQLQDLLDYLETLR